MFFFKILAIIILLASCADSKDYNFDKTLLLGNWYDTKDNFYQEYYFDNEHLYTYDPYSGNISKYNYQLQKDSLVRFYVHPELVQEYKFYDRIIELDSFSIKMGKRSLEKLREEKRTLEQLVNDKISKSEYFQSCIQREQKVIPLNLSPDHSINIDSI